MSTSNCRNGLRRMGLLAVAAIFLAFAAGCGEAECEDGQTLVTFDGEDQCFDDCDGDEDCADGFECDDGAGVCLPTDEDDNDNDDNDNDNNGEECVPEEACADYCYEKSGRCLEEGCDEPEAAEGEIEACEEGLEAQNFSISGCLDRAQLSDASCQEVQDDAADYAEEECDGEDQRFRQCTGRLFLTAFFEGGEDLLDSCDCQPANTAESCETDGDCDEYGRGICDDGTCQAECYGWDGALDGFVFSDPTCAEDAGQCSGQGICFNVCQTADECPQDGQGCLIIGTPQDGTPEATGACLDVDPDAEGICLEDGDCADGEDCFEGNCMSECEEDEDCENGPCGDEGTCEITFTE